MPHAREAVKAIKGVNTLRLHGHGIRVKAAEDKPASKSSKGATNAPFYAAFSGRKY